MTENQPQLPLRRFAIIAVLITVVLAGIVSSFASSSPDGLDSVTRSGCTFNENDQITDGKCIAQKAKNHWWEAGPLAGYSADGVSEKGSTGVAGIIGVFATLVIAGGLAWTFRRRDTPVSSPVPSAEVDE